MILSITRKIDIGEDDIFPSLIKFSKSLNSPIIQPKSSEICFELIKNIIDNNISCKIQNLDDRTYFKREFPNQGFIELDWHALKINKYIRAIVF